MSLDPQQHIAVNIRDSLFCLGIGQVKLVQWACSAEQRLKARLPRACHSDIDWLLENSDFTASELLTANKRCALAGKNGQLVRQHVVLDRTAGTFLMAYLMFMLVFYGWLAVSADKVSTLQRVGMWSSLLFMVFAMMYIATQFFWPQAIAKQAIAALKAKRT